jgi:arylsulfatase A-like enzyme
MTPGRVPHRRPGRRWLGLAVLLTASLPALAAPARPNVLFIALDDLNHWVGHLGRNPQTRTPHIDRLARQGVTFSRAYCAAPVCNPSRAALMSGLRPGATGVYDNGQDWQAVIPETRTLTTQFRTAGYRVVGAGKIYHASAHRPGEWDAYLERDGPEPRTLHRTATNDGVGGIKFAPLECADADMPDYRIVSYALAELARPAERPLFLAVGLHKPHMPWTVPRPYYDLHPLAGIRLPPYRADDLNDIPPAGVRMAKPEGDHAQMLQSGRWKEAIQGYLAAVSFCDAMVGRLLDGLDRSAARTNTIVVLWGDHGWHLGEKLHWRKFALWEEATRAPLIWVVPGVTRAGAVCGRPVDFMSVYPTLCDLAGLPIPAHVQGPSLRPLLADPQAAWDRPAVTTFHRDNHAVRTADYRYIRYADGAEELYRHADDPYEWTNLAADPRHAAAKATLTRLLPGENQPELPRREAAAAARRHN